MQVKNPYHPVFKIFYAVFAYIILFSLWWAYLLYAKNEAAYQEKIELNEINYQGQNPGQDYYQSEGYHKVHSKYLRQRIMIIAEGAFFLLLLVFGLMRVRRVFLHEIELASQQRNFMLSITHELKSPLSTVKLSLQTMQKRKLEPEKSEQLINNSLADLERLESLVDNILFAAKIERDDPGFLNESLNISELLSTIVERLSVNKKAIKILSEIPDNIYWNTDQMGFRSVIINLIENAIKYSEANTYVEVQLTENETEVLITIKDQGIGIADEEKNKIFQKFYRVGNEDTRKTKGTGLGLYIVKRFIDIYKGTIQVEDNQPKGSVFILRLPK